MIVHTFDGVQALSTPSSRWDSGQGGASGDDYCSDVGLAYQRIYETQPPARNCIDFLGANIAQLPIKVFRRVSDTDRVRLPDHQLARWLQKPNPATTAFRLMQTLMSDLGLYLEAYWLKVRYVDTDGKDQIGLVALPPEEMTPIGKLLPQYFIWTVNGKEQEFAPSEIVYFNGYNPANRVRGMSQLRTLTPVVAEDRAAAAHRAAYWRNASRHDGVIEREKDAPIAKWTTEQKNAWREQWQARFAGAAGAGSVALLEPGMKFVSASFSPKDSEFIAGAKFRRELYPAAWQIPQPMVGMLDHATYSNVREQRKQTYQDTLGPWNEMITQEIERQLLIECEDQRNVYVEIDINAKLQGTFEERASAISVSVGRAWRTVNEARALDNLPRIDDPDLDTVAPQQGGPSDASAAGSNADGTQAPATTTTTPAAADDTTQNERVQPVLLAARRRQLARLEKVDVADRPDAFLTDIDRWNRELVDDLTPVVGADAAVDLAIRANVATFSVLAEA